MAGNGRARGNIFQATNIATRTAFAMPVNGHMSQFSRSATGTLHNLAINNHTTTDASADGEINHVLATATRAKLVLTQPCCIGIILDEDREIEMFLEEES